VGACVGILFIMPVGESGQTKVVIRLNVSFGVLIRHWWR